MQDSHVINNQESSAARRGESKSEDSPAENDITIHSFTEVADQSYIEMNEKLSNVQRVKLRIQRDFILFRMCLKSDKFWTVYLMATFSILFGYYSIDVFKQFGQTVENLSSDEFLTMVGSIAAIFNALRFVWSAFLDYYSYK